MQMDDCKERPAKRAKIEFPLCFYFNRPGEHQRLIVGHGAVCCLLREQLADGRYFIGRKRHKGALTFSVDKLVAWDEKVPPDALYQALPRPEDDKDRKFIRLSHIPAGSLLPGTMLLSAAVEHELGLCPGALESPVIVRVREARPVRIRETLPALVSRQLGCCRMYIPIEGSRLQYNLFYRGGPSVSLTRPLAPTDGLGELDIYPCDQEWTVWDPDTVREDDVLAVLLSALPFVPPELARLVLSFCLVPASYLGMEVPFDKKQQAQKSD